MLLVRPATTANQYSSWSRWGNHQCNYFHASTILIMAVRSWQNSQNRETGLRGCSSFTANTFAIQSLISWNTYMYTLPWWKDNSYRFMWGIHVIRRRMSRVWAIAEPPGLHSRQSQEYERSFASRTTMSLRALAQEYPIGSLYGRRRNFMSSSPSVNTICDPPISSKTPLLEKSSR